MTEALKGLPGLRHPCGAAPGDSEQPPGLEGSPPPGCLGVSGFFQPKLAAIWPSRASHEVPEWGGDALPAKGTASCGCQL